MHYTFLKILFISFAFILLTRQIFPQWSTDPNNNLIVGYGLDPHICSDSAGGCYVTYDYENIYYPRKLALERIDKYGYKPWGINKRILGEFPGQSKAEIIEDGEGGVIVSYEDREETTGWTARIRVQKVDSNGNLLWGPTGVKLTLDEINQGSQKIVNDGEGGAVIVWVNTLAEYKVNRISNTGERMWGDNGIVLGVNGYYDPVILVRTTNNKYIASAERNTYKYFDDNGNVFYTGIAVWLENIISDGYGGIIITSRGGQWPQNWQLRAQRKDSFGNSLWQEPHIVVAESLYFNSRPHLLRKNGYYYFGWSGMKNGIDRIAQSQALRQDGSKLFPQGNIQISENSPIGSPYIIPSDTGKTIFIWNDATISSTTFAQLYDTLGNKLWNENGVVVSYPAIAYQNTTDGQGGFITCGPINQFTVVAQQLSKYGNLGEVSPVPVELISFTGVSDKDKITLSWITATELNNSGFEIQRNQALSRPDGKAGQQSSFSNTEWELIGFVTGQGTTTEIHSYSFIDENLTYGKYKYRLKQIDYDGIYKYSSEIEIVINNTTTELALHQNYPNPFNSSTIIRFQIAQESKIRIDIYNVLGEKIKTVIDEYKNAGSYIVEFDASEISSGVYIYKIQAGDFTSSKKMILLK